MKKSIFKVETTCPSIEMAELIANTLVFEKLAACVQMGSEIRSVYTWKGKAYKEAEIPITIKTSGKSLERLRDRVSQLHSYECPQWIITEVSASEPYADWVEENTVP